MVKEKVNLKGVRVIFFDLDNILWNRDEWFAESVESFLDLYKPYMEVEIKYQMVQKICQLDNHGMYLGTKEAFWTEVGQPFQIEEFKQFDFQEIFRTNLVKNKIEPETMEFLAKARQAGLILGITTNGTSKQHETIKMLGIKDLVDFVLVSAEVGFRKPEAEIFQMKLNDYSLTADLNQILTIS